MAKETSFRSGTLYAGDVVRHFKRDLLPDEEKRTPRYLYRIIGSAKHTESGEELMIYEALYGDGGLYARPLEMFLGETDLTKYPSAVQRFRFEKASDEDMQFLSEEMERSCEE